MSASHDEVEHGVMERVRDKPANSHSDENSSSGPALHSKDVTSFSAMPVRQHSPMHHVSSLVEPKFVRRVQVLAHAFVQRTLLPAGTKISDVTRVILHLAGHQVTPALPVQFDAEVISQLTKKMVEAGIQPRPTSAIRQPEATTSATPPAGSPNLQEATAADATPSKEPTKPSPPSFKRKLPVTSENAPSKTATTVPSASPGLVELLHLPPEFKCWTPIMQQIYVRAASQGKLSAYNQRSHHPTELPDWMLKLTGRTFLLAAEGFHKALAAARAEVVSEPPLKKRANPQGVFDTMSDSARLPALELPRNMEKQIPMFSGGTDHVGTLPVDQFLPLLSWFDNSKYKLSTCGVVESAACRFLVTRLAGTALHHYRQHLSGSHSVPTTFDALHTTFLKMFSAAREHFAAKVTTFKLRNPISAIPDLQHFIAMVECSTFDVERQRLYLLSRVREMVADIYPHLLSDSLTWGSEYALSDESPFRDYVLQVIRILQHHHSRCPPKPVNGKSAGASAGLPKPNPAFHAGSAKGSKPHSAPAGTSHFQADLNLARSKNAADVDKFLSKYGRCTKCGSRQFPDKPHECPPESERADRKRTRVSGMITSMEKGFHPNNTPTRKFKPRTKAK